MVFFFSWLALAGDDSYANAGYDLYGSTNSVKKWKAV